MSSPSTPNLEPSSKEYKEWASTDLIARLHHRYAPRIEDVWRRSRVQSMGCRPKRHEPRRQAGLKGVDRSKIRPSIGGSNLLHSTPISVTSGSALFYMWIEAVAPTAKYNGSGGCWGLGVGGIEAAGVLFTKYPFPTFASATETFLIQEDAEEAGAVLVQFMDSSGTMIGSAALVAAGIGAFVGVSGDFCWS
ncbi:hypothetical protein DL93DRAFT_2102861 [Clavulina sp. PMI_390]|nr:hypothetical protein DL93DRAFT_2102861 [Clavulina sp. PMI_390]